MRGEGQRMRSLMLGLASVAMTAIGPAWAADMAPAYKVPPPPASAYGWTGLYAGVNVGYGWRDPSIDFSGNAAAQSIYFASGVLPPGVTVDPKGALAGLQGGYNRQLGRWVLGVEADLDFAAIHDAGSGATGVAIAANQGQCLVGPVSCNQRFYQYAIAGEQKLEAFGTLRGRGGILLGDRLLLFATGGLAFGDARLAASVTNTGGVLITTINNVVTAGPTPLNGSCLDICAAGAASRWLLGWTVGGGFEYALAGRWSAKAEYLYYDLGSLATTFADPGFPKYVFSASAGYTGHIARVGLNFKLD
jgi:outer membrane immunogenic protein